ncbi:MAG: hypothetical protein DRJ57_06435 [Thermoprotei archaeon]|nr:MAG: hypothetical protein DRJ57_06435 [Thermoprotei archaeon]
MHSASSPKLPGHDGFTSALASRGLRAEDICFRSHMQHVMHAEEVLVVRDPEVAKLLADETRRKILLLLRVTEMTPQQLAKLLGKNVSSITHHLSMLERRGLVRVARVEVRRNLVVKWYRAAAKRIIVSYELAEGLVPGSEHIAKHVEEGARRAAEALVQIGAKLDEQELAEAAQLIRHMYLAMREVYERYVTRCIKCDDPWGREMLLKVLMAVSLYRRKGFLKAVERLAQLLGDAVD